MILVAALESFVEERVQKQRPPTYGAVAQRIPETQTPSKGSTMDVGFHTH